MSSRLCAFSGCKNVGVHLCSGCGEEIYCSKECQKSHWADHKIRCKLATKPEAAAFMQSFDALSPKQLKNILKVKASSFDQKKREIVLNQLEKVVEKPNLINLVKQHVQTSEIDVLLSATPVIPTSTSAGGETTTTVNGIKMKKKLQVKNPANLPAGGMPEATPEQLKMQANMMRKNPDLVRQSSPIFAKMTNEQIAQYADQLDQAASNPDLFKEIQQLSKLPSKEREQIQSLQEGLMGSRPMDDKWINSTVKLLKSNPDLLKKLFDRKGPNGESIFPGGITSEHIGSFIDGASKFDASTLQFIMRSLIYLGSFVKPTMELYQKADKATFGLVRYALIALAGLLVYFVVRGVIYVVRVLISLVLLAYNAITNNKPTPSSPLPSYTAPPSTPLQSQEDFTGSVGAATSAAQSILSQASSSANDEFEF